MGVGGESCLFENAYYDYFRPKEVVATQKVPSSTKIGILQDNVCKNNLKAENETIQ